MENQENQSMRKCPYCAESIQVDAIKCKHCGEILDSQLKARRNQQQVQNQSREQKWSPGIAALISFIIPGGGQMYKGEVGMGIFWFTIVIIGYCMLLLPGIILHIICVVTAAQGDPYK